MIDRVMFLSIPGLRPADLRPDGPAPTLAKLAQQGASCELTPTFPCVTSPVQASMLTGVSPDRHGVTANGFYYRDRGDVEFWVAHHNIICHPSFFSVLAEKRPDLTSAVWHAQNIKGAAANYIITPSPIHEDDGSTKLWCYGKPEGLYGQLLEPLGHFPLQHYWGPLANLKSTNWILDAALWLAEQHAPNFQYIYIPHLDYAAQKFGPDAPQSIAAVTEFDTALGAFIDRYNELPCAKNTAWILAGEYALTEVNGAIHPNRMLREVGFLAIDEKDGYEYLNIPGCDAFAMVDHQLAHVYVSRGNAHAIAEVFEDVDGIAQVLVGDRRNNEGIAHDRAGDIVLISDPDKWFTYYWWTDDAAAPPFARTVDIHAKPGYDPVELFIDMPSKQIPLNASLVKGSHGAPAANANQKTVLITTNPELLEKAPDPLVDTDVFAILCKASGIE